MPLMQGLPKQTSGSMKILLSSALRSITPASARDRLLEAIWSRPVLLDVSRSTQFLTAKRCSGIIGTSLYWGVAKWQGTGFWSRDRRFESCRPSSRLPTTSGRSLKGHAPAPGSAVDLRRRPCSRQGDQDEVQSGQGVAHHLWCADGELRDCRVRASGSTKDASRRGPSGR